jgi:Fic family protein
MTSLVQICGFKYTRHPIVTDTPPDKTRAVFRAKKMLVGLVYDTIALEDNPFTFPEVKTLLDGITVGGHKLSDEKQVLNQAKSWKCLFGLVEKGQFELTKKIFLTLNALVAEEEALEWGKFRTGQVSIAGTNHAPPPAEILDRVFNEGNATINQIENQHERAIVFFLFGSLQQFFWDGNKRTSRLMMNGMLLSQGYDVINIPATKKLEFNQKMIRFYDGLDAAEMVDFLVHCSLDATLRID